MQPLFAADASAYIDALAALQKTLGRCNDCHVVLRMAKAIDPAYRGAGRMKAVAARHAQEIEALRHRLHKDFAALRRLTPFWMAEDQPITLAGA